MSHASDQRLQFSIDETVWLRNGFEAEEILSLALDPDITIEESTQYIAIKGSLRLTGEYKPSQSDESGDRDEDVAFRVVDELTETEDGTAYMEHHFPVDITIPASRVRAIEDVYVTVDSLDYSQPNKSCIQLLADISISGLVNQENGSVEREVASEEEESYDPFETVSYEAYREPEEDYAGTQTPKVELNERANSTEDDLPVTPLRNEIPFETKDDVPPVQTPFKQFKTDTAEVALELKAKANEVKKAAVVEKVSAVIEVEEEDQVAEEEVKASKVKVSRKDENALYLTKMLTNENEQFSRVKICIVQEGDNLETISERYKVPVTNILRRNQLSTDRVDEGQVLYIPVKG
ncbi:MAG TPA: stage VI sporulation protein D [Candidatus Angelobacter sp.]|nr:stage VI sporulation protein D [Candidatus Angelobacter sp.]